MNKQRRTKVRIAILELQDIIEYLREIGSEEQDALYNMPDNLQDTDRYLQMEANVEVFDDLIDYIENAIEDMEYM